MNESDDKIVSPEVLAYVGTSDVREIDTTGWKAVGVKDQKLVRWDSSNGFQIPLDQLSADALEYCTSQEQVEFMVKTVTVDR